MKGETVKLLRVERERCKIEGERGGDDTHRQAGRQTDRERKIGGERCKRVGEREGETHRQTGRQTDRQRERGVRI